MADSTGLEPAIFSVTGRRVNHYTTSPQKGGNIYNLANIFVKFPLRTHRTLVRLVYGAQFASIFIQVLNISVRRADGALLNQPILADCEGFFKLRRCGILTSIRDSEWIFNHAGHNPVNNLRNQDQPVSHRNVQWHHMGSRVARCRSGRLHQLHSDPRLLMGVAQSPSRPCVRIPACSAQCTRNLTMPKLLLNIQPLTRPQLYHILSRQKPRAASGRHYFGG